MIGLETWSNEAYIKEDFSKKLYDYETPGKNKTKQKDLIVSSRKDITFSTKLKNVVPYNNIGLANSVIRYENSWMELTDSNWKKN